MDSPVQLELRLLGRPRVSLAGTDLTSEIGAKGIGLLAYLAQSAPKPVPRELLAGALWSEKRDEAARYRLRHTLWDLRRTLGDRLIQSDQSESWLALDSGVLVDVVEFQRISRKLGVNTSRYEPTGTDAAELHALVDLYGGELLQGISVRDAPIFEEWLLAERERLELMFQEALWCLAQAQRSVGAQEDAAHTLNRLIESDPLRERSYRALMGLHLSQGDRAAALRVYKQCVDTLAGEMGISPSPDTERLHQMIVHTISDSAGAELERASRLLEAGCFDEALSACMAADLLFPDQVTRTHISLLRAEIALARGEPGNVLSFIRAARKVLGNIASGESR